jgi:hypothetical protein
VAAKPIDTDVSILASLAEHAQKMLQEFVELGRGDESHSVELAAETRARNLGVSAVDARRQPLEVPAS